MMRFFRSVRSSIYDPSFYRQLRSSSASAAFGYFALLVFVLSVVVGIVISVTGWHQVVSSGVLGNARQVIASLYPDELILHYRDGRISSNVAEPYFIATPPSWRENDREESSEENRMPANLVVISTRQPVSHADFARYDTNVILAGDSLWTFEASKGKTQIYALDRLGDDPITVDKATVNKLADKVIGYVKPVLAIVFVLLPFPIFLGLMIGYLVYLLLGACLVWVVAKVRHVELGYGQSYKLGLHLMTLPLLYALVAHLIPALDIPWLFTIILVIVAYLNLRPVESVTGALIAAATPAVPDRQPEAAGTKDGVPTGADAH